MSRRRANVVPALVDFPITRPADRAPFPWRAAALAAAAVAAVELVLLVLVGGTLLAKPDATPRKAAATTPAPTAATPATPAKAAKAPAATLSRGKVSVMILNGNGRTGAASAAAARVKGRGYRVGTVGNAPRQDYPRSLVMYRRGFAGEGARLAKDLGITVVGPLDGMRPRQLKGAHAVVVLGG